MAQTVPDDILAALTDVDMPKLPEEPALSDSMARRRGVDMAIISQSAWGGTSACSGSDKQTLHTANTADLGDNFHDMARAIGAGGAMDEDTAYVEAVGSVRAMASLQFMGLPLPQDIYGGTLRYQTDHDEVGRATSCGPRTSRLMVRVLAHEAMRLGIPFFNQTTGVQILTAGAGDARRVIGILAVRARGQSQNNPYGLVFFQSPHLVIAAGGPGELYRDSVFPNGCFGALGLALQAGVDLVNLTESQFGIGTRREGFPWNLSGTYVQAIPHIYSLDTQGHEHHFLAGYYRSTQELASNIFRKGYQWPFHATRMLDFGSSLIDLAIHREGVAGRKVFMDFNRNPLPVAGDLPFALDRLDDDVRAYLGRAGAHHAQPIDRLRHMNPLSIQLYLRYKVDIAAHPLEFAVNNQHMNGGIAVDSWARSSLRGMYAVGEAAGTHGVTRPGGAALNAGQVMGTRAAEHLASVGGVAAPSDTDIHTEAARAIDQIAAVLKPESTLSVRSVKDAVQSRMSDHAGILCRPDHVAQALSDAKDLNQHIAEKGIAHMRAGEVGRVLQWQQMALVSEAVLMALNHYIACGGGSRGARAIVDDAGDCTPMAKSGPLEDTRFRSERAADKSVQIVVRMRGGKLEIATKASRKITGEKPFFERDWPAWLTGLIFDGEKAS
jgi:succinate dehydrogenase / fumarate reductase, flavoprotein subunit